GARQVETRGQATAEQQPGSDLDIFEGLGRKSGAMRAGTAAAAQPSSVPPPPRSGIPPIPTGLAGIGATPPPPITGPLPPPPQIRPSQPANGSELHGVKRTLMGLSSPVSNSTIP